MSAGFVQQHSPPVRTVNEIIKRAKMCMVTTSTLDWTLAPHPLNHQWLDENGDIWYLSVQNDIETVEFNEGKMQVVYANASESEFATISGVGKIISRDSVQDFQSFPFAKTLRNEALGPAFALLRFTPYEISYWDKKLERIVTLTLSSL